MNRLEGELAEREDSWPIALGVPPLPLDRSLTIQAILLPPYGFSTVLWAHNMEEALGSPCILGGTPKPPGWGLAGGGFELDRDGRETLDESIRACGIREIRDETGFTDFELFRQSTEKLELLKYTYRSGHQKLILWGRISHVVRVPIVEADEIDRVEWFDLTISPVEYFGTWAFPNKPYWSHVRGTIIGLGRIWRIVGLNESQFPTIHPLWNLVFPVGQGDPRFPKNGYHIRYSDWYKVIDVFIKNRLDYIDLDMICERFRRDIERHKQKEERMLGSIDAVSSARDVAPEESALVGVSQSASMGRSSPTAEDIARLDEHRLFIEQENEEYAAWAIQK